MVLADGLRDVASELRMIEAADLIAFIRTEQFGNIANLVASSAECYFMPGTLRFGQSGDIDVRWGGCPAISLDMEFHHLGVNAFFRLRLEALHAGVELTYIAFDDNDPNPDENTRRLAHAIADARVSPIRPFVASAAPELCSGQSSPS